MPTTATVFIVDDDPGFRRTLHDILKARGYAPTSYVTGQEALAGAAEQDPAAALIDLRLGDMSGVQVLAGIKARAPDTECILLTGYASQTSAIEAVNLGAYSYIQKPYDMEQLLLILRRAVEKRANVQALRESEERYRSIVEYSPAGILIVDDASRFIYVNSELCRILGRSRQEIMGHDFREFLDEESCELVGDRYVRRQRGEEVPPRYEFNIVHPDGEKRRVEISSSVIQDSAGKARTIAQVLDITERKRAEEAERDQRVLAEALRDTAAALASTLSFDEILDRILVEAARVVPHDASTIMLIEGDHAHIVRSRGYAEHGRGSLVSARFPIAELPNLRAILETDRPVVIPATQDYPGWVRRAETAWVRSHAGAPIRAKGQIIGFLNLESATPAFFTPTHAERLQAFADQAGVAIENARLYDDVRRHAAELEQRVAERTAALQAANEQLQQVSQFKSEFIANVSHELRTPLANIVSYLWLLDHGLPEKHVEYMDTLQREAELLHQLIEDLLHISAMDLGQMQPVLAPVDLNRLVTLMVGDRTYLFADHGLTLEAHPAPDLPPVQADEKMLSQVLTNLMTNAMNYTPSGGRVTVKTGFQISDFRFQIEDADPNLQSETGNRKWVTFSVSDTGAGITAEDQAHLFERFFRGEAARQTRAPGTGLGLAICQEIVERHGGRLTVESQVGVGSTFTVWLPVEREA